MHRVRLATIVIAIVLAAAVVFATGCKDRSPRSVRGKGADFTLKDLSGNPVSMKDFRGKVVMLEFWATWCPPCRAAIPELIALHERLKDRDFVLVAISMDESKKAVENFVEEYNIPYIVLMDDAGVSDQYGVFSIPTSFVIDQNGKVVSKHAGYGEGMIDGIAEEVQTLMAMTPAPAPTAPAHGEQPQSEQQEPSQQ